MPKHYLTYQYKAHIKGHAYDALEDALSMCKTLYNAALEERKEAWRMQRKSITYFDQCKQITQLRRDFPDMQRVSMQIQRGTIKQNYDAFTGFYNRVKRGEKAGYPRYRSQRRYSTISIGEVTPAMLKRSEDGKRAYIKIKGLPTITLRTKRLLPDGKPKTLFITKRPCGFVVSMAFEVEPATGTPPDTQVGIDMGVSKRLTLSDGSSIEPRKHDRSRENRLRRKVSRAKKGSNSRIKKVEALSRETYLNKIRNRNACHEITTDLTRRYGRIAVEDLQIKNMTRSAKGTVENPGVNVSQKRGLNRSISEQTWGVILYQLTYKAEYAGGETVRVNPRFTSRTCSRCSFIYKGRFREYAVFECSVCGLVLQRDHNAAINIEARAYGAEARGKEPALSGTAPHAQPSPMGPVHAER